MPRIEGRIDAYGSMVFIHIGPDPLLGAALGRHGRRAPVPVEVLGLLDTGASCSAIDPNIVQRLGLRASGIASIHTPSTGRAYVERACYDVTLTLGAGQSGACEVFTQAIECELASQGFFALIGRDVLSKCILTFDGPADRFVLEY